MDSAKVDSRQLAECLKVDFDGYLKDVVAAINDGAGRSVDCGK